MPTETMPPAAATTYDCYILEGKEIVPVCRHVFAFWRRFHDPVIAKTGSPQHVAETVFTGIKDEDGNLFRTTVTRHARQRDHFDEPTIDFVATWRTYEEAIRGHCVICRRF